MNVYFRYCDLNNLDEIIATIERALQNHPTHLTLTDIFMVAGDFTGINKDAMDQLTASAPITPNGDNNNLNDFTTNKKPIVNAHLEQLGFYSNFETNATSFSRDQVFKSNSDVFSSCNILCRERMPSTRSAFREALYKTKSPLSIYNQEVPFDGDKLCGYYGVIRDGLCHMAIPRGWIWGGPASEHFPIWVDLYTALDRTATVDNNARATDGMRRRTMRRNSLTSCRSLKMPSAINGSSNDSNNTKSNCRNSKANKLERGATISTMMDSGNSSGARGTTKINIEGNSIFYDANDSTDDAINQSNSSSASSVNHTINLTNGKCS